MTKEEMLDIFLEETGFQKDAIVTYEKVKAVKDNNENINSFKRYALAVTIFNSPINYSILFMSDKFDLVR